jgi:hypothetical protein
MPLFRLRSAPPAFLAVLLLSTFGAAAPASAANAVLTLDTDRAQEDTSTPAIDLALPAITNIEVEISE